MKSTYNDQHMVKVPDIKVILDNVQYDMMRSGATGHVYLGYWNDGYLENK